MKLPLTNVLVGALLNASTAIFLSDIFGNVVNAISGTAEKVVNGISGRGFADRVKRNPINEPHIEKVSFQLTTPCGRTELLVSETGKFRDAPEFDVSKKTVVFVTGWLVDPDMAKAYHCRGGYNFVIVNTGGFITNLYVNSAYHTGKLGEFAVGSAGPHFHKLTGQKLVRITGLDRARPCFVEPVVFPHIARGDADFVDIMHSNPTELGTEEQIGDVDFYPRGLDVIKPGYISLSLLCSHELAIQYYAESVNPDNENSFMGARFSNYSDLQRNRCVVPTTPMDYATDVSSKGIHYISVRDRSPYGINAKTGATFGSSECGRCPK